MSIRMSSAQAMAKTTPVAFIRVVVHTMGLANLTMSDNHWSIYLMYSGSVGSTRANMMAPEYGDPTGVLDWSEQQYALTTSALSYWDFGVARNVSVGDIASLIYNSGRDQYDMSGGGSGCRWWVYVCTEVNVREVVLTWSYVNRYVILSDCSREQMIGANEADRFYPNLLFQYHRNLDPRPLHMVQGEFR